MKMIITKYTYIRISKSIERSTYLFSLAFNNYKHVPYNYTLTIY